MEEPPKRSSGALWSIEEDQRLYDGVKALTASLPGRSLAAVVTRIAWISRRRWWNQKKEIKS